MSYGVTNLKTGTKSLPTITNGNCVYRASYTVLTNAVPRVKDVRVDVKWIDPGRKKERNVAMYTSISMGLHP